MNFLVSFFITFFLGDAVEDEEGLVRPRFIGVLGFGDAPKTKVEEDSADVGVPGMVLFIALGVFGGVDNCNAAILEEMLGLGEKEDAF